MLNAPLILTLNGGSSSIRFAFYGAGESLARLCHGKVEGLGLAEPRLSFAASGGEVVESLLLSAADRKAPVTFLLEWLASRPEFDRIEAIGHRVVHGMGQTQPEVVTTQLLSELHRIRLCDPQHLPREIELMELLRRRLPEVPQLACFDTAFHSGMPRVATLFPIPRRFESKGVRRYGFHGLSYAYLLEQLQHLNDPAASIGRVILALLGSGASMAAVLNGRSVDTSMGFTPTSGLVMSTRSGDLDPGLVRFLARTEGMTMHQFDQMVNHESGLLGISETSPDIRDLLKTEAKDPRAAEAVALFCYQARKCIGSFAAALGGLDTLVFSGGIGEHQACIRTRICEGLSFLGIEVDPTLNAAGEGLISRPGARVSVRVIATDEELMIARSVWRAWGASRLRMELA